MAVHAKLTAEQIVVAQEQCGLPDDDGNALFQECKAVRYCVRRRGRGGRGPHLDETNRIIFVQLLPRRKQTQEKYERELASLAGVFKVRVYRMRFFVLWELFERDFFQSLTDHAQFLNDQFDSYKREWSRLALSIH